VTHFILGRNPRLTLIRASALIVSAIVLFGFVLLPVRLHGISMLPTYNDGGLNFANRAAYWWREPARGDAVAIRMAGEHAVYVKRIVGLPREHIAIIAGVVLVNDEPLVEPAVVYRAPWNVPAFTLGDGEYFLIGDNRAMAAQNHDFGTTTRARVVGKMLF
jgi:signal peptidase I